MHVY